VVGKVRRWDQQQATNPFKPSIFPASTPSSLSLFNFYPFTFCLLPFPFYLKTVMHAPGLSSDTRDDGNSTASSRLSSIQCFAKRPPAGCRSCNIPSRHDNPVSSNRERRACITANDGLDTVRKLMIRNQIQIRFIMRRQRVEVV
jgi:hypothetical protein